MIYRVMFLAALAFGATTLAGCGGYGGYGDADYYGPYSAAYGPYYGGGFYGPYGYGYGAPYAFGGPYGYGGFGPFAMGGDGDDAGFEGGGDRDKPGPAIAQPADHDER